MKMYTCEREYVEIEVVKKVYLSKWKHTVEKCLRERGMTMEMKMILVIRSKDFSRAVLFACEIFTLFMPQHPSFVHLIFREFFH